MRTITFALLALCASPIFAQEGMYAGFGFGNLDYAESTNDPIFGDLDDTVASYKIYGGFEFNEYLAVEIGYGISDEIVANGGGNDPIIGDFTTRIETEFTTTTLKALGQLPLDWGVLLGGIGYFDTDADLDLQFVSDVGAFTSSGTVSDDGMMAMVGIEWRFGRFGTGLGVRLEYEWLDIDSADGSTIGLGFAYRF